jgi:hypothetical protein
MPPAEQALQAKKALVDWCTATNHYELVHVDLHQLSKLRSEPKHFPKLAEYIAFGSMHQHVG